MRLFVSLCKSSLELRLRQLVPLVGLDFLFKKKIKLILSAYEAGSVRALKLGINSQASLHCRGRNCRGRGDRIRADGRAHVDADSAKHVIVGSPVIETLGGLPHSLL